MKYTLTLESNDNSAFNIIRNIYECFRMLGEALLIAEGIILEDHIIPLNALMNVRVNTKRPLKTLDNLRRTRNNINYYGYHASAAEARDIIDFAQMCFNPLSKEVKKIIENQNL